MRYTATHNFLYRYHTIRMENNTHDYKDTIRQAAELDGDGEREIRRENKLDAEFAYEALAVTTEMGMYGQNQALSELLQLQLAQELLYKLETPENKTDD